MAVSLPFGLRWFNVHRLLTQYTGQPFLRPQNPLVSGKTRNVKQSVAFWKEGLASRAAFFQSAQRCKWECPPSGHRHANHAGACVRLFLCLQTVFQDFQKIPGFQRNFVWDVKRASKLIESFGLGKPKNC